MTYTLAELNDMDQTQFVEALGAVFEHTPAIAADAWNRRPFASLDELHEAMVEVVHALSPEEQRSLILAHPDLGSKAAMADASVQEQASIGLNQLTPDEYDRFQQLNTAYKTRFGFPFIVAVKHHTKTSILDAFERRLRHSAEAEREQAIAEIIEIARLRLIGLTKGE